MQSYTLPDFLQKQTLTPDKSSARNRTQNTPQTPNVNFALKPPLTNQPQLCVHRSAIELYSSEKVHDTAIVLTFLATFEGFIKSSLPLVCNWGNILEKGQVCRHVRAGIG